VLIARSATQKTRENSRMASRFSTGIASMPSFSDNAPSVRK
jgi:hypothetical protein